VVKGNETLLSIRDVADEHNRLMCAALSRSETIALHTLLSKLADQMGLMAGLHPGYRSSSTNPGQRSVRLEDVVFRSGVVQSNLNRTK
jgi:hypothetical protein